MKLDLFDYTTPLKFLERLNQQYESLKSDATNKDKALDFCLTAWSLADWDFYYHFPDGTPQQKGDYRDTKLFPRCEELRMMHDISIGAKHFVVSTPKSNLSQIEVVSEAAYSSGFSFAYDRPCIRIKFDDGGWLILNAIINKVYDFWNQYLNEH